MPRSKKFLLGYLSLACTVLVAAPGCSGNKSTSSASSSASTAPAAATAKPAAATTATSKTAAAAAPVVSTATGAPFVNRVCAIENEDPVNPAIAPVVWKGQNVGFCCANCKAKFNQMTDVERNAAVTRAIAASAGK